ncbi:MAG: saccharopine dehydrogenase NADP-binding domain-containing protein [Elusimicrobia bacterium]|nr:saccharopine dehydrogenase NADP-binding domain-containing protein [Elusimicrobiota bacterium]MDE2425456.1 saccharopine dehydrogenase NADP-binding domain-containing protein [Elusimicrobiota bacterium]
MKVAVLGGFGAMAEAALRDLAGQPEVSQVAAVDLSIERAPQVLSRLPRPLRRKIAPLKADLAGAAPRLGGVDVVLNCAWYELNLRAMDLALRLRAHYVDLGGLYHMTLKQLKRAAEFRRAGRLAVLGCGSTPGITNMMAARMAGDFTAIDSATFYDASHEPPRPQTDFSPPFSIRTMLSEHAAPAPVLKGGRIVELPARGEEEWLDFPSPIGRVKTCAVIHSEAATLPAYLKPWGLRELSFKIAYPQPVLNQLDALAAMGFGRDPEALAFLTRWAARRALKDDAGRPRDFEVLRARLAGRRGKLPLVKEWDCELRPTRLLSAGTLGVGCAGAIAARLCALGKTKLRAGAGGPESVLDEAAFFSELLGRPSFSLIERTAHPLQDKELS